MYKPNLFHGHTAVREQWCARINQKKYTSFRNCCLHFGLTPWVHLVWGKKQKRRRCSEENSSIVSISDTVRRLGLIKMWRFLWTAGWETDFLWRFFSTTPSDFQASRFSDNILHFSSSLLAGISAGSVHYKEFYLENPYRREIRESLT